MSNGDPIHPDYYHGDTVVRYIEEFSLDFRLGSVLCYITRAAQKNGVEDLKKAEWFLQRAIYLAEKEKLEREKGNQSEVVRGKSKKS